MSRRRLSVATLFATLLVEAGCTSIPAAPTSSTASGASSTPSALVSSSPSSTGASAIPTVAATIEATLEPTPAQPTATTQTTRTPKPTAAAAPNLVVKSFEIDPGSLVAEIPFDVTVTFRNNGTADAGPFTGAVQENNLDDGVEGPFDPFPVDGLAAGKSVSVDISVTLPKDGNWQLSAIADFDKNIDESNEDDNTRDAAVKVLAGLPDFEWFKDGLSVFDTGEVTPDGHKIELHAKFTNSGSAIYASSPISIGIKWYRSEDSASGDLTPFAYGDDLEPGGTPELSKIDYLPGSGTYTLYAYLDDGRVVDELSEDNNESPGVDITVN